MEQQFLYGHHVLKSGLARITENTTKYQGVVVYNMKDVPLVRLLLREAAQGGGVRRPETAHGFRQSYPDRPGWTRPTRADMLNWLCFWPETHLACSQRVWKVSLH